MPPRWDRGGEERVADVRRSRRRGPRAPGGLPGLAAAALLALVAVGAARGPLGSGAGRPAFPSDLVATLVLLLLVAGAAALVLAVVVLGPDRRMLPPRRQRNGIMAALLPLAFLLAVWLFHEPLRQLGERMRGGTPVSTLPVLEAPEPSVTPAPPGPLPLLVAGLARWPSGCCCSAPWPCACCCAGCCWPTRVRGRRRSTRRWPPGRRRPGRR